MTRLSVLAPYICRSGTPMREAMARLNETEHVFQLILDADGRLLGTLTDGDIRRALLRGDPIDAPVDTCMNRDFVAERAALTLDATSPPARPRRVVTFVPLLDDAGGVSAVHVRDPGDARFDHALVMAGGFGRRLGERTRTTPKPLLPVGGRPILDHVLSALEDAGVGRVHVSVHYLADQIRDFVAARDNRAEVTFIEEDAPLGTAGALGRLDGQVSGPVLVVNGDVLSRVDLSALHDFHLRHGLDATVGVARYDVEVPFGVVRYDEDGLFESIEEKPRISNFIAAGIYYLGSEFTALVPRGQPIDMPELLTLGREIGLRIGLFPIHEYWTDIGRPDDLDEAARVHDATDGAEMPWESTEAAVRSRTG